MDEQTEPSSGLTRRGMITRAAILGGTVWVAPAVTTVGRAGAAGTPAPGPCACTSDAFGLRVIIPGLGIDRTFGVGGCLADTGVLGRPDVATVQAAAVCGDASSDTVCQAEASVAMLDVVVPSRLTVHAEVLASQASASCDPCATTGGAGIAELVVDGIAVNVTSECNNDVLGNGLVIFNEQTCTGDTLSVNALHIRVGDIAEVIVSHSEAGADDCPCRACA